MGNKICSNDVIITSSKDGIKVQVNSSLPLLTQPKITGITTTSCGACNTDGLDTLITDLPIVEGGIKFDESILHLGLEQMKSLQDGFSKTGGMHSAGLLNFTGDLKYLSEDIGRHNAVDKVVGKSITDEDWEGFLDWKNDVIPDMRYEICEDYEYYAEGRSEDE